MYTKAKNNTENISKKLLTVLCLCSMSLFIAKNEYVSRTFYEGLCFCLQNILPTLFPFMFASSILICSGSFDFISDILEKTLYKSKFNNNVLILCALGIICGFPVGAKCTRELYEQGKITKEEADICLIGSNCASPAFVIGAIGSRMLGSVNIGVLIWSISVLTSITITLILLPRQKSNTRYHTTNVAKINNGVILKTALSSASASIINLCFLVSIFYLLATVSIDLLDFFDISNAIKAAFAVALEMCVGCKTVSELMPEQKAIYCAFAVGFGGISTLMQVKAEAHEGASITKYLVSKLICGCISSIFVFFYCKK